MSRRVECIVRRTHLLNFLYIVRKTLEVSLPHHSSQSLQTAEAVPEAIPALEHTGIAASLESAGR